MRKGIIMEMDDAFLTLLTPEGEFLRSKRQNQPYSIGEEINFFPFVSGQPAHSFHLLRKIYKPKILLTAVAALLIFIGSIIPMYQNNKAYAYMSIDANPSIELAVNKKMQVIEVKGFNKEGKKIITKLKDWEKTDVSEVAQSILTEIKSAGLINNREQVIISTVRTKQPEKKVERELQKNLDEIKANITNKKIELTVLKATKKEQEKAHELGITAGKYKENQSSQARKEQKNSDHNSLSSDAKQIIPPGQLKKSESSPSKNQGLIKDEQANVDQWKENSTPPGQLKKEMEEKRVKQNQGQIKKQDQQLEKSNNLTNGIQKQKEKTLNQSWQQNSQQNNSNQQNKWKQNSQQNHPSQQNNWNQKWNQTEQKGKQNLPENNKWEHKNK